MGQQEINPQSQQSFPADSAAETKNGKNRMKSFWLLWPATVALAGLLYWGLGYLPDALTHESTDDAFIEGHIVAIAPKVSGHAAKVYVKDNQPVKKGDLLVEIEPGDYEARLAQKNASIRTSEANLKAVLGVLKLMAAKVDTAGAVAKQAHAQVDASRAVSERARADFQRAEQLFKDGTISKQEFDSAEADTKQAAATLKADEENAAADDSKVAEAKAQLTATQAGADLARAQVNQSQTDIHVAELDLSYTKILAPCDGRVTRKAIEPGSYVEIGQMLLAIVQPDFWVVANFKETQLTEMRPGQPAEVAIEALANKRFRGHVDSIQSGSGARFSLLPPENAVGNFVKVVQRVPVKIVFDEPLDSGGVAGPGMSALPSVHVKDYSIPRLATLVAAVVLAFVVMVAVKIAVARVNHNFRKQ
jgi:membrane fusion protein, multidrug efflux system